MVVHLGRLKIVTRRKEGECRYKHCDKDHKLVPGEKVLILTKLGKIGTRTTVFYKAYHPDCFGLWAMWMIDQTPISKDGRKAMTLEPDAAKVRAKLVRERARILRSLRTIETGERLDKKIRRITEVDRLIGETGYPVIHYKGRRSIPMIEFEKFLVEVKERFESERRVPKSIWEKVRELGMESEFASEMAKWRKEETQQITKRPEHYEDKQEDEGEQEE